MASRTLRTCRAPSPSTRGLRRRPPTACLLHSSCLDVPARVLQDARRRWVLLVPWVQWARACSVRWGRCGVRWSRRRGRGAPRARRRCGRRPGSRRRRRSPRVRTIRFVRWRLSGARRGWTGARPSRRPRRQPLQSRRPLRPPRPHWRLTTTTWTWSSRTGTTEPHWTSHD
ncbi:hypothetical protein O3G_MSEX012307 [Manduca sexta]|uniref:Uncharacterized protein n=1 Tax=Manduca sexta TaxID=7130 RepID=A0A921ZP92_MANSE|nr:hypothetical protein O3G_MSEX012307 [Manduca sexta]